MRDSLVNFVRCGQVRHGLVTVLRALAIEYLLPVAGARPTRPPLGMRYLSVLICTMMFMMIPLSIGIQTLTMRALIFVKKGNQVEDSKIMITLRPRLGCPSALWFLCMWKISWSPRSGEIGDLIGVLGAGHAMPMVLRWPPVGQS
eukprot:2653842-Pyramimonas_sp.AAC.1